MLERLIENWLDSASERSYQSCFCQMLLAQGYRVLHSTRHAPIEFGKDIIAIAPDGVPCAYQLKGNPGGRLTHAQFRDIHAQLWELATQAIVFPGVQNVPPRTYLVTNGNVDEEVQRAIDDLNRQFTTGGLPARIEIITRGNLLGWAHDLGTSLWPQELGEVSLLLELLTHDGRDLFPIELLDKLLVRTLALGANEPQLGHDALKRRVTSAALLVAISLGRSNAANNHYAAVVAWCMYAVYSLGAVEKHGQKVDDRANAAILLAENEAFSAALRLAAEVAERKTYVEGGVLEDWVAFRWRRGLLHGLFALTWFRLRDAGGESFTKWETLLRDCLADRSAKYELWGEAAMPSVLAVLFFRRTTDATARPDLELAGLVSSVIRGNQNGSAHALPTPYYSFEELARHHLNFDQSGVISDVSFDGSSFFASALLQLLVRVNLKQECKNLWPDYSRMTHKQFVPGTQWEYCVWRSNSGRELEEVVPLTYTWVDLVTKSTSQVCDHPPVTLLARPHTLFLWCIIAPHRATPDVVRRLADHFHVNWYA